MIAFQQFIPLCYMRIFFEIDPLAAARKIYEGFNYIWAWRPFRSCNLNYSKMPVDIPRIHVSFYVQNKYFL